MKIDSQERIDKINAIKASRFVREVIEYKNGRVWVWCTESAYDSCGRTNPELFALLRELPPGLLSGHDCSARSHNLRKAKGTKATP